QALCVIQRSPLHYVWTGVSYLLARSTLTIAFHGRPGRVATCGMQDRIQSWWKAGYFDTDSSTLIYRFTMEAKASLPALPAEFRLHDLFEALNLQRLRLKHDQKIPEWAG